MKSLTNSWPPWEMRSTLTSLSFLWLIPYLRQTTLDLHLGSSYGVSLRGQSSIQIGNSDRLRNLLLIFQTG